MRNWTFRLVFVFYSIGSYGQWNYHDNFDTYIGFPPTNIHGTFRGGMFLTNDTGLFSMYQFNSPSAQGIFVKNSLDGGLTWNMVYNYSTYPINSCAIHTVKKHNTFFHIWSNAGILQVMKTFDAGATWTTFPSQNSFAYWDFACPDTSVYYLLYLGANYSQIGKYHNGNYESKIDSFYLEYTHLMCFPDTTTGYISSATTLNGKNHSIKKSTSGGTNWSTVLVDTSVNIRRMYFTSNNLGYVACDSGLVLKTVDGGINWQYLNTNTGRNLRGIYFLNDSVGFAAGDSGVVVRTLNGGFSWSQDSTGTNLNFTKIFFVNDSIGFAFSELQFGIYSPAIYKTNLSSSVGIWEICGDEQQKLRIYPNPTSGKCEIILPQEFLNEKTLELRIFENGGRLIQDRIFEVNSDKISVDLKSATNGIYTVTLGNSKKMFSGKILSE